MPGERKKLFSDIGTGVAIGVGTVLILAVLSVAYGLWPRLWEWLQGGEGEVAHRVVYLLTVFLVLYHVIAPRRPLPIRVTPVNEPGSLALLTIHNLGHSARFYATAAVQAVKQSGTGFRRVVLRPTWGISMQGAPSEGISRDATGDLLLALSQIARRGHHEFDPEIVHVSLIDYDHKGETFSYPKGRAGGVEIDLEVRVTRNEPHLFLRMLPAPRSFFGRFTISGDQHGGLSIRATPRDSWWTRFRRRRQ
jgi:hypothetical protein